MPDLIYRDKMNKKEISDLTISWLVISFAFSIIIRNNFVAHVTFPSDFIIAFLISAVGVVACDFRIAFLISAGGVGTGFVFHELAHRTVAIHFGAQAEYRAWSKGLLIALVSSFLGFVFAAPGAVYIYGQHITRKENGLIALAGPLTNGVVAIFFISTTYLFNLPSLLAIIFSYSAYINMFLGLFNMIPFPPLDGSKIIRWNPIIWAAVFLPFITAFFFYPF